MHVVYIFAAIIGALFAALTWLRVAPAPAGTFGTSGEDPAAPATGCRRTWALPLCVFGLVGLTLHLLGRPFLHTLAASLIVGPPVGLISGWVGSRINGD